MKKIALFFFLFISYSHAELIKEINISGISSLSRGTILSYLPIEVGDDFNENISNLSLQNLFNTGLITDASISFKNGYLEVSIKESPVISFFEVKGFKNDRVLNEDNLATTLKDSKLSSGNIFKKSTYEAFIRKLKEQYKNSGHYNANIVTNEVIDSENRIGIEINIDEGSVAKIQSFNIEGAKYFEEENLIDKFNIGEPDFFLINFFTEKDYFSQIELDAGIQKIKSLYISSGFLDFEISENTVLSEDKSKVTVLIKIIEGKRYSINKINFSGDYLNVPLRQISSLLNINEGDIFEQKKLIKGLESISDFFGNQGFAFAKVNADTREDKERHNIDIDINIDIQNRIYLNRIIITGNTRTQDDVVRREIKLLEGQHYSKEDLNKSIENIKRLGFFKDVQMKTIRVSDSIDRVNIFIEVDENKTGEFSIGLSQSSTTGAAFNVGIKENNFLGTGNTLDAKLVNSEAVEEISFFYSNPNFNLDRHSLGYGAFSRKTDSKFVDLSSYTLNEVGLTANYGIPMSEYAKFSNGFRLANIDLQCGYIYSVNENTQCSQGKKTSFSLLSSISENSLNDSTFPTDGVRNSIKADISMPFSDFSYLKFDLSHSSYYPTNESLTFKLNTELGYIDSYSSEDTPFYKRYFGGGSNSIRGFNLNSLGPRYSDNSNKGGEISFLTNGTLISPLSFIENSDNMRVGAFIDFGSISESVSDFSFGDMRASTGVAFSWLTPIGPIGAHWAKPLVYKSADNLETFSFNLGTSF